MRLKKHTIYKFSLIFVLVQLFSLISPLLIIKSPIVNAAAGNRAWETLGLYTWYSSVADFEEFENLLGRPVKFIDANFDFKSNGSDKPCRNTGGNLYSFFGGGGSRPGEPDWTTRKDVTMAVTTPLVCADDKALARDPAYRKKFFDEVAAGVHDDYYEKIATTMLEAGHGNSIIRLGHEPDLGYPWSYKDGLHREYEKAWLHARSVMKSIAPNLLFDYQGDGSFHSTNPATGVSYADSVPGVLQAADIIGIDKYDRSPWDSIKTQLDNTRTLAQKYGKPMSIPEWGLWSSVGSNGNGDNPQYIQNMYDWINSAPASGPGSIVYHSYFNGHKEANLDQYPNAKAKFIELFGDGSGTFSGTNPFEGTSGGGIANAAWESLGVFTGSDMLKVEQILGRKIRYSLIFGGPEGSYLNDSQGAPWATMQFWKDFSSEGKIMVLDVKPTQGNADSSQFNNQLQALSQARACEIAGHYEKTITGAHDKGYESWANAVIDTGQTTPIIRIGSEYDGHWHPYSVIGKCNTARYSGAQYYKLAFIRIHDIFERVAAERGGNVDFRYDMNGAGNMDKIERYDFSQAYPGDQYVDYIGTDMYSSRYENYEDRLGENSWLVRGKPTLELYTNFARQHGLKFSMPEWGLWYMQGYINSRDNYSEIDPICDLNGGEIRNSGRCGGPCSELICGDNAYYIEQLHNFFNENSDVMGYHIYFHTLTNSHKMGSTGTEHRLWLPDGSPVFVNGAAKFAELYGDGAGSFTGITDITGGSATENNAITPEQQKELFCGNLKLDNGGTLGPDSCIIEPIIVIDEAEAFSQEELNNLDDIDPGPLKIRCSDNRTLAPDEIDSPIMCKFIQIVNVLSIGVSVVATITVAVSGLEYSTSRGNPQKTARAVARLTQVGMAIVIYVFGWSMLNWLIPGGLFN